MAIPNNPNWSALTAVDNYQPASIAKPPSLALDVVQAISLGPMELSDSGGKLNTRYWIVYAENGSVLIKGSQGEQWSAETLLFNELEPVKQLALTFDQLGRPLVFYRISDDMLKLYWYNPLIEQTELKILAQGHDPHAGFDAPQDTGQSYSDAMLFYVRDDVIYMRIQRDRFETEYTTPATGVSIDIRSNGLRVDNRYQVVYRHELTNYVPPDPVPPTPPVINGNYKYRLFYGSCFFARKVFVNSPATDDIEISFSIDVAPEPFPQLSLPVYSDGGKTIQHPMLKTRAVYSGNSTELQFINPYPPIEIRERISIELIYNMSKKLTLMACFNGRITVIDLDFILIDGDYKIAFTGSNVVITLDGEIVCQSQVDRGIDGNDNPNINNGLIGGTFYNNRQLFTGAMSNVNLNINGDQTFYGITNRASKWQESTPAGEPLEILQFREGSWVYIMS